MTCYDDGDSPARVSRHEGQWSFTPPAYDQSNAMKEILPWTDIYITHHHQLFECALQAITSHLPHLSPRGLQEILPFRKAQLDACKAGSLLLCAAVNAEHQVCSHLRTPKARALTMDCLVQSVKDMPVVQDGPPPGGFPSIRYARRIPSTGPTGFTLFAIGTAVMAYGFYRVSLVPTLLRLS